MFCLALFREMRRVIADHVRPERLRLCRTPGTLMLRWPGTRHLPGMSATPLESLDTLTLNRYSWVTTPHFSTQQSVLQKW
jgi:hypothetical protein